MVEEKFETIGTPMAGADAQRRTRFQEKVFQTVEQRLKESGGLALKDVILGAVLSIESPEGGKRVLATDRNPMLMMPLDSLVAAQGASPYGKGEHPVDREKKEEFVRVFANKMMDMSADFVHKTTEPTNTNRVKYLQYLLVFVRKSTAKELAGEDQAERVFMKSRVATKISDKRDELEQIALEMERYEKRKAL